MGKVLKRRRRVVGEGAGRRRKKSTSAIRFTSVLQHNLKNSATRVYMDLSPHPHSPPSPPIILIRNGAPPTPADVIVSLEIGWSILWSSVLPSKLPTRSPAFSGLIYSPTVPPRLSAQGRTRVLQLISSRRNLLQ